MTRLTDRRLAKIIGITPRAVLDMKKNHPDKYRLLRLGILCEDIGLDEEDLSGLLEHKKAIRPLFEIVKKVAG